MGLQDNIYYQLANKITSYFDDSPHILVEVGAADPCWASSTFFMRPLAEQRRIHALRAAHELISEEPKGSWDIISIEPNPAFCQLFRDANLPILQYAATSTDVGATTFQVGPAPMSFSSLQVRYPGAPATETINVEAMTLNTILAKHRPDLNHIDALIVDVEGWELDVIDGIRLDFYQPKLVILEFAGEHSGITIFNYHRFMDERGYYFCDELMQDRLYIRGW